VRAQPSFTPMLRGPLPRCRCRHVRVDGLQRPSGRNASPCGNTPSTITSPTPNRGSRTEISPGARTHHTRPDHHAHDPPFGQTSLPRLTPRIGTEKRHSENGPRGRPHLVQGERGDSVMRALVCLRNAGVVLGARPRRRCLRSRVIGACTGTAPSRAPASFWHTRWAREPRTSGRVPSRRTAGGHAQCAAFARPLSRHDRASRGPAKPPAAASAVRRAAVRARRPQRRGRGRGGCRS
jgi:hypothetical protein